MFSGAEVDVEEGRPGTMPRSANALKEGVVSLVHADDVIIGVEGQATAQLIDRLMKL